MMNPTYAQLYDWYQRQQPQPQIQQSIMSAPTIEDALKYPVALGNSIMFKIENQPLIIEKSMGFSQLDSPVIKYFDISERKPEGQIEYAPKTDLDMAMATINELRQELQALETRLEKKPRVKKEEENG
jgi:hypothetical protein